MKRIFSTLNRRNSEFAWLFTACGMLTSTGSASRSSATYPDDSPEGTIIREVAAFCESSNQTNNAQNTDYIHLPAIVESAESSPNAAKEAAYRIRKFLADPTSTPGSIHYNAIMLIRILIDNPGHTFARNLDAKFASTVKDLLRQGRDMGVQQFLRETLEFMESQRSWDEDLASMVQMWNKEKGRYQKVHTLLNSRPRPSRQSSQNIYGSPRSNGAAPLPPPDELSARITEARSSAKLLLQFVQSTPPAEILDNELMAEFSYRCRTASGTIQSYIHATNPAPDEDTLLTLIEANDELSVSLSKHQHAILNARKALGNATSQSPELSGDMAAASAATRPVPPPLPHRDVSSQPQPVEAAAAAAPILAPVPARVPVPEYAPAPAPAPQPISTGGALGDPSNGTGRYEYRSEDFQVQNPFADDNTGHTDAGHQQIGVTHTNERFYRPAERTT